MSVFVHNDFESYATGTTFPQPGFLKFGFASATIVTPGWKDSLKAIHFDSGVGIGSDLPGPTDQLFVAGNYLVGDSFTRDAGTPICQARNQTTGLFGQNLEAVLVSCETEKDGSISFYTIESVLMANTTLPSIDGVVINGLAPFYLKNVDWVYLDVLFTVGAYQKVGDPVHFFLKVSAQLLVNEVIYLAAVAETNIRIDNLPTGVAKITRWASFGTGGDGNKLDSIYVTDTGGFGEPGNPLTGVFDRVTQYPLEYSTINYPNRMNRVSQAAVEHSRIPVTQKNRVSQIVVEVMGKPVNTLDGMKVREI